MPQEEHQLSKGTPQLKKKAPQVYDIDGKTVIHKCGEQIMDGRGKALLDFRDEHLDLWNEMQAMGMRFYQQPAGFGNFCRKQER